MEVNISHMVSLTTIVGPSNPSDTPLLFQMRLLEPYNIMDLTVQQESSSSHQSFMCKSATNLIFSRPV